MIASFLTLAKSFTNPISQLANQFNSIITALAGASRIFKFMDEKSETDDGYVTLVNAKVDKDGNPIECEEKTDKWDYHLYRP
jgi:ATP-binding cassette subfamily B protein